MIVALFRSEDALVRAVQRLREARIGPMETYTPAPLRDAPKTSPVPLIVLAAGLIGAVASLALQTWSYTEAYPFPIGGRPQFSWPSFTPTVFENGVLIAIVAGFLGFMAVNRMPRLYDKVDEAPAMRRASGDGWIIAVTSEDTATESGARAILQELDAVQIDTVRT